MTIFIISCIAITVIVIIMVLTTMLLQCYKDLVETIKDKQYAEEKAERYHARCCKFVERYYTVKNRLKAKKLDNSEIEHLKFINVRLIEVHEENPNFDYMLKLKDIISKCEGGKDDRAKQRCLYI